MTTEFVNLPEILNLRQAGGLRLDKPQAHGVRLDEPQAHGVRFGVGSF